MRLSMGMVWKHVRAGRLLLAFLVSGAPAAGFGQVEKGWTARHELPGRDEWASAVTVDAAGNVYVAATSGFLCDGIYVCSGDYVTVKYDGEGRRQWTAIYDSGGDNQATDVAVGPAGNVFVTGWEWGADVATVKYDAVGNQISVTCFENPWLVEGWGGEAQYGDMKVDEEGNVYLTGSVGTMKYDSGGARVWEAESGGREMAVDGQGNVYVAGVSRAEGFSTIKFDPAGHLLWAASYEEANGWFVGGVGADAAGNAYVTGSSRTGTLTVKYDSGGRPQWSARHAGGGGTECWDWGTEGVTVDATGNLYVTGTADCAEYLTIKYDSSGRTLWAMDQQVGRMPDARAVTVSQQGNVYVTGSGGTDWDIVTVEYVQGPVGDLPHFLRGDSSADGRWNLTDAIVSLDYQFRGGETPACMKSLDADDSGVLDITDPIYLLQYLFVGGPAPPEPAGECWHDPTPDLLDCVSFPLCP